MTPIIIGWDPGKQAAVACLKSRRLAWVRSFRGDDLSQVVALIQAAVKLGQEHGGVTVVIELQHGGRGDKVNFKSLETLYRRRHEVETICTLYGVPVVTVWPATWQSQLKEVPRLDEKGKRRDAKVRAVDLARRLYGDRITNDDEAAAALMARWYTNQPGQGLLPFRGETDGTKSKRKRRTRKGSARS